MLTALSPILAQRTVIGLRMPKRPPKLPGSISNHTDHFGGTQVTLSNRTTIEVVRVAAISVAGLCTDPGSEKGKGQSAAVQVSGSPLLLAALVLEINHFKAVNHMHGHQAGAQIPPATACISARRHRLADEIVSLNGCLDNISPIKDRHPSVLCRVQMARLRGKAVQKVAL